MLFPQIKNETKTTGARSIGLGPLNFMAPNMWKVTKEEEN